MQISQPSVARRPMYNPKMSSSSMIHKSQSSTRGSGGGSSSSSRTAYITLRSRPMSKASLFAAYFNHMFYFSSERGVMHRLLRGILTGRPALDVQLIHGTSDIADRRESTERAFMQEVVSLATASCNNSSISSVSGIGGSSGRPVKLSPTFTESVAIAWAGDDRLDNGRSELTEQTTPLLAHQVDATSESNNTTRRARLVPHSVTCRTLSRRMLFVLLLTCCVNFLMSMTGMVVFFAHSGLMQGSVGSYGEPVLIQKSHSVSALEGRTVLALSTEPHLNATFGQSVKAAASTSAPFGVVHAVSVQQIKRLSD